MISTRCILTVRFELEKIGIYCPIIVLGSFETFERVSPEQISLIKTALLKSGLELIENKKSILVERIKIVVVEMIYYSDDRLKTNFSDYLSKKLNLDYTYLANIFSEEYGSTIEQFVIFHRIQKVKELIGYDELNLTQISFKLHFSSVAHLSNQFRKVTGVTPSYFKNSVLANHFAV